MIDASGYGYVELLKSEPLALSARIKTIDWHWHRHNHSIAGIADTVGPSATLPKSEHEHDEASMYQGILAYPIILAYLIYTVSGLIVPCQQ